MKKTENISEHISFKEATYAQTASKLKIKNVPTESHIKAMQVTAEKVFQPLREWAGHPIRINSFYRSADLCEAIKSSRTSQHTKGQAIDLSTMGEKTNAELFEFIKDNLDFDQMIWEFGNDEEPQWIHVSYVNKKANRKNLLKAYRKGSKVYYKYM